MVEQIRISPEEVRGYGNICEGHTLEDFIVSNSGLAKEKENVHGALTNVYRLVYSVYGLMFNFDKGNKQLYLQMAEADILSFGFDTANKQLYLVDEEDTGFNLGFDPDTRELYITDEAPPIISISASSPYLVSGETTDLVVSLVNEFGSPVSGKTVTISDGTSSYSGLTNLNGTFTLYDITVSANKTYTATYSTVSDSVTIYYSKFADLTGDTSKYIYDSRCNVTSSNNEITVTRVSGTYIFWANKGDRSTEFDYTGDFTVEFDLLSNGNNTTIQIYDNSATTYYSKSLYELNSSNAGHYKIVKDGQVFKTFVDGVEKTAHQINSNITGACRVGFRTNNTSTIKFRNFVIY